MPINRKCIKCGKDDADIKYVGSSLTRVISISGVTTVMRNSEGKETLIVTCTQCGYEWLEKPLDAQELTN